MFAARTRASTASQTTAARQAHTPAAAPRLRLPEGNQARLRSLAVSQRDDPLEREADRVADAVVAQRSCEGGCDPVQAGACSQCVQRKAESAPLGRSGTSGHPLPEGTRSYMEQRIGHGFERVRVHTDGAAAEQARSLGARAFTVGSDIFFGQGRYAPDSANGTRLLAHELAHVVQQGASAGTSTPFIQRDSEEGETAEPEPESPQDEETAEAGEDDEDADVSDGDTPVDASGTVSDEPAGGSDAEAEAPEPAAEPAGPGGEGDQGAGETTPDTGAGDATEMKGPGKGKGKGTPKPPAKPKAKPEITSILVDLPTQKMTIRFTDSSLDRAGKNAVVISSGKGCPNTKTDPCPTGAEPYCTPNVTDVAPGKRGDATTTSSDGSAMGWYLGVVDSRDIGIHDSQTASGAPRSHGCVRVGKGDKAMALAKLINQSSTSKTKITIKGKAPTKAWKTSKTKSFKLCPKPKPKPKAKPKTKS